MTLDGRYEKLFITAMNCPSRQAAFVSRNTLFFCGCGIGNWTPCWNYELRTASCRVSNRSLDAKSSTIKMVAARMP